LNVTGKFITFEGGEGVGKSTQVDRVANALRASGITVVTTREPGGTSGAEAIRTLLMTGNDDKWNAQAEALLFAAARSDHVSKVILPALARGDWVVCDRFLDSTRAYQGGGGGVSDEDIVTLHRIGSDGLTPVRTILFDMPADQGVERAHLRSAGAQDRMGSKSANYLEAVRTRFLAIAADAPDRIVVIDASQPVEAVTDRVLMAISDLLP
jgi:dTMP kinase